MNMYINSQSDEIRRLSERNEYLENTKVSLVNAWQVAVNECKREQKRNDDLTTKLFWSLSLNCAMGLFVGWVLS